MEIYNSLMIVVLALLCPLAMILTLLFLIRLSPQHSRVVSLMQRSKVYVVRLALAWSLPMVFMYLILATRSCLQLNVCSLDYYLPGVWLVLLSNVFAVVVAAKIIK